MSTATTLMSLLPQLKSMEHSIISMIVEIISKLATLTDAEIFVLVQDSERRLISGSSSLVELYLAGNLVSRGDDVEMEAPPSSVKLKRHHSPTANPSTDFEDDAARPTPGGTSTPTTQSILRNANVEYDGKTSPDDGGPLDDGVLNLYRRSSIHRVSSLDAGHSMSPSSPKKQKMTSVEDTVTRHSNGLSSTSTALFDGRIDVKVNSLAEEVDLTSEDDVRHYRSDVDDPNILISGDDDIDFYPLSHQQQFLTNTTPPVSLLSQASQANAHSSFANSFLNHHPSLPQPSPIHSSNLIVSSSFANVHSSMLVDFDALNLPVQKMNFLKSVPPDDVEKLFEKGTAESKVLTSVFYDFGKSLSGVFRLKDDSKSVEDHLSFSKTFLNANLNAFLELFPSLQSAHLSNVRVHDMKPEAFLRLSARNGFKRGLNAKRF